MAPVAQSERWLVALDIDGTLLTHRGEIDQRVIDTVAAVMAAGHEVMLATGRPMSETVPVIEQLGLSPEFVVCSNGAVVWKKDPLAPIGYSHDYVETFDPALALETIRPHLPEGKYAVEDSNGDLYCTELFPVWSPNDKIFTVTYEELQHHQATRVVVIAPTADTEEFLVAVEKMGLHRVTYAIGMNNWLDISPDGVNKATGLEKVRAELGIDRSQCFTIGDGRNDIDMLRWAASGGGRGVVMGDAPSEVVEAGNEITGSALELGVVEPLKRIPGVVA